MAQSDWKRELDRMMHMLDDQLEKIDGSLQASGLSFNEELRQNVTKMIQLRLESTFANIDLKQWGTRQANVTKKCCKSANDSDAFEVGNSMKIVVKTPDARAIPFDVGPSTTVGSIKTKIRAIEGFTPDQQLRLIYIDRQLQDGLTMSYYNIQTDSTLRMEIRRKVSECEWQTLNE